MSSAIAEPVFSLPLDHFRRASVASIGCGESIDDNFNRPTGLKRFVGDASNQLLRVLTQPLPTIEDEASHLKLFDATPYVADPSDSHVWASGTAWPLVFFGPSGTGKTSLALTFLTNLATRSSAFGQSSPSTDLHPAYITAVDFDRRFRSAMETDSVTDFRDSLVRRGGLLIDNLHELATKHAAQQEIVLLIDAMNENQKPILFTMQDSPNASNCLVPKLVSRLSGGLSLPVSPPGIDARYEIVRELAELHGLRFTIEAVELLANRLSVTVPRINHFMLQLKTSLQAATLFDYDHLLDIDEIVRWMNPAEDVNEQTGQLIAKRVAEKFGVKLADLSSQTRKQTTVLARGVAIYLIRSLMLTSFKKIGDQFGNRDHSTIMHSYRKIEAIMKSDDCDESSLRQTVNQLKQELAEQMTDSLMQVSNT